MYCQNNTKNSVCPYCRSVLPTTVVPKEYPKESKEDEDDESDYESDYYSDYEYLEDSVDEEEKYLSKQHKVVLFLVSK
jgi:hypothetical protein